MTNVVFFSETHTDHGHTPEELSESLTDSIDIDIAVLMPRNVQIAVHD